MDFLYKTIGCGRTASVFRALGGSLLSVPVSFSVISFKHCHNAG